MSVKNGKFLLLVLSFLFLVQTTVALVKCNRKLLQEFGLNGMPYSVYSRMHVCGYVRDKCCTIADEIRLHKFWNDYSKPIVDERVSEYMSFVNGIVRQFYKLMAIDPQLIVLKYVSKQKIPYHHEVCYSELSTETWTEQYEFHKYHDTKTTGSLKQLFYMNLLNKGKKFNPRKYTHDITGQRKWGVKHKVKTNRIIKKMKKMKILPNMLRNRLPKPDMNKIVCRKEENSYYKEMIIVNEEKTDFCLGLYQKFLKLDNRILMRFLPHVKNMLQQLVYLKSDVYCAMCDAHQQRYFDIKNKTLMMSERFCSNILKQKLDLFNFMHIFFIEYMDEFLQYTECFETNGTVYNFPFKNFLIKYKRRVPLMEKCFENLDKDFMKHCWFLCNKYTVFEFNWFFDTDIRVVKRVYLAIYSFMHKMDVRRQWGERIKKNPSLVKDNINGLLIEPLNPSHTISSKFYVEKNLRKKLLGKLDTRVRLNPKNKKAKKKIKAIDGFLKKLGLPTFTAITKLRKAHKKLKKKHKLAMRKHKFLIKHRDIKKALKAIKLRAKKKTAKAMRGKKGYSKVNGLKDHLFKILKRKKIHAGYRPRRVLLNDKDTENQIREALTNFGIAPDVIDREIQNSKIKARYLRLNKVPKTKILKKIKQNRKLAKTKEKDPQRFKAKDIRIEPTSDIYHKVEPHFNVKAFKVAYDKDGMNPITHFALVNYRFNITTIIQRNFKEEEEVTDSVITEYLRNNAKSINRFNFDMRTFVGDHGTVFDRKYHLKKRIEKYAKIKKRAALLAHTQKSIRAYKKRAERAIKRKRMFKLMRKRQKALKLAKAMGKHHRKVIMNNHIENKHFYDNFHGFWKLFTNIFGT